MISRRRFLEAAGVTGAGLGVGTLGWRAALAGPGSGDAPKRLLILSHNHGYTYDSWKMRPDGRGSRQSWEADLTALPISQWSGPLSPLYAHRQRLIVPDGLSLATAELDMDGYRHEKGWIHSWTGDWAYFDGSGDYGAVGPSIDQVVAAEIARADRLPSIEVAINYVGEDGREIVFSDAGQVLPLESSAAALWQRLFGPSLAPDPLRSRQQQALDFAYGEYRGITHQLGGADRDKVDTHFDLLSGLGKRLEGMAELSCPDIPAIADQLLSYDDTFDAMSELIAAAFACDITRVATFSLGDLPTADFGHADVTDDVHKGFAHNTYIDGTSFDAMTDYLTAHAVQVARLVDLLSAIPDFDGRSVMDNTLIVWGSELADGWHGYRHYCPVIIGGDWHFRTGRYLHWPHRTPIEMLVPASVSADGYTQTCGKPNQHLLVSIAQAMGLQIDQVGLDHVVAQGGQRVSLTGPLPDLT